MKQNYRKVRNIALIALGIVNVYFPARPALSQTVTVNVYIKQNTVVVNQMAELAVEVSGGDMNQVGQPELPDLGEWFSFAGSRGSSQNVSIINGRVSSSITYTYGLLPLKVGTATIPPVKVRAGSKEFVSQPLSVAIKDAGAAPPVQRRVQPRQAPGSTNEPVDIFLVANVDKTSVYQNQGITIEYKVYFGSGITVREYTPLNTPNTAGFWTEEYPMPATPRAVPEEYKGRQYNAVALQRVEIFPTNSGEFELDPKQIQFMVQLPRRRSLGFFDDFDSFFNNPLFGSSKKVTVSSNRLKITAKPLPAEGRPASFNGAVGTYSITADTDNNMVKTHDSVTLKVTVSGTGNIKLIGEPKFDIPDIFEQYDPKVEETINRTGSEISGKKTFEYVLIPRREGVYTINPIPFAYFDPGAGSYRVVTTVPIRITVEPGEAIGTRSIRNLTREEIRLVGQDIRFIKESVANWHKIREREFLSWSFLAMLLSPVLLFGLVFVYSRHLRRLNADIGYKRSRKANAVAAKRLKKAYACLKKNDPESFYPEIARALQEYIADKLNIAAAGIVTEEIEKILRQKKIGEDLINGYIACLKTCDYHRFTHTENIQKDMEKLYQESRKSIYDIEERLKKAA